MAQPRRVNDSESRSGRVQRIGPVRYAGGTPIPSGGAACRFRSGSGGTSPKAWISGNLCFLIFLITAIFPTVTAAGSPPENAAKPPVVTVTAVTEQEVNPPMEFVGRVEAVQSVDLLARVKGFLEEVYFKEGSFVKAGDGLYSIEQGAYKAQVNIDRAKVAKARATLTRADLYLKRLQTVKTGGVSASDVETAVSDYEQAKAALEEAEATLAQSELNLGYTGIKAPISGRIGRTAYTQGGLVGPESGTLARIVQTDPIRVVFSISENRLPEIQKKRLEGFGGEPQNARIFRLRLPNGEVFPITGRPDFMDNVVNTTTGTIAIWALFDNPDSFLVPGQFVTVLASDTRGRRMPVVPQASVLEDREGRYVFVVDSDNRVVQRRITTGDTVGTEFAVLSGLVAGERVIVQGVQKVRSGQVVTAVTSNPN